MLIPSPTVAFDEVPEMSALQVNRKNSSNGEKRMKCDFILVNYANADMVRHTGNEEATIVACQATDKSLSILIPAIPKHNGTVLSLLTMKCRGNSRTSKQEKSTPSTPSTLFSLVHHAR